jgi:3-isopropylmalate dehydrogenase
MSRYNISVLKGDGVGPEVVNEALKVLDAISSCSDIEFSYKEFLIGGASIDEFGIPLSQETIDGCLDCDAVLLGAIGGAKWDKLDRDKRPESGLLQIRKELNAYANIRPVKVYDSMLEASPLKENIVSGVDMVIVRELTGGIYFGKPRALEVDVAYNTMIYKKSEIEAIAKKAFDIARTRSKKICSVDKANVLEVSQLWRETIDEMALLYKDVEVTHMYVDNAAMQIMLNPKQFDVMLTSNLFGDILSDEASVISGSIGLLGSSSIGDRVGLYEPIHGSAPDIAGQGIANPIATILSASMMLGYSFGELEASKKIELGVEKAINDGYRTKDIASFGAKELVSTSKMGDIIAGNIERL